MTINRKTVLGTAIVTALLVGGLLAIFERGGSTIRIGVLHSMTGPMAVSERPLADAVQMAVEEINLAGGLLGREVETVVVDGRSDADVFASEAERLIDGEEVSAVFGVWTSEARRTVKSVFESRDHLLFYPVQHEGIEESPNIVYTGAAPNQQIVPALRWTLGTLGGRVFLVGSDYVFPRTANRIIRDYMKTWKRGSVVGERYLLLEQQELEAEVDSIVREIARTRPDVILNTINGEANRSFFRALREAGITPDEIPSVSFSIAEVELQAIGPDLMEGEYAAWNYFGSLEGTNLDFVRRFQERFGEDRVTSDPIEASYFGVLLWADAVAAAGTVDPATVRRWVRNRTFHAPGGMVYVDGENQYTWKMARVGRVRADGHFDIVWSSIYPLRPMPYPDTRTRADWETFLADLYAGWGNRWSNPGAPEPF